MRIMASIQSISSWRFPHQALNTTLTWLAGEHNDTPDEQRVRLLNGLLLTLGGTTLLYLLILAGRPFDRPVLPLLLGMLPVLGGLYLLNWRGHPLLVAQLLTGLLVGILFVSPLLDETTLSLLIAHSYFALLLMAGLLLDWKTGLEALVAALLLGSLLVGLEHAGVLTLPGDSAFDRWLRFIPALLASVSIMIMARGTIHAFLNRVQANKSALREAFRRLTDQATELDLYQQQLTLLLEERTMALDEVSAQAMLFKALADNSPICFVITNLDQTVTYANAAFHQTFGYDAQCLEAVGQPVTAFWPPEAAEQQAAIARQLVTGGWTGDVQMQRQDGTRLDIGGSAIQVTDSAGQVCGQAMILRDISYRKAHERELRQALEAEQQLGALRSHFVSMVSHEFRTPLTIIQSSADGLERFSDRLDAVQRAQRFNRIYTQVQHMVVLLDEVMTIGRLESRQVEFNPAPLDVVALCQNLIDEMRLLYAFNPIELILEAEGDAQADLDEKLMRQIVTNLLSNGLKYSPEGTPLRVTLSCPDAQVLILQVADQGIGIPAADQANLFEAFHRASNVGTIAGTGLGLAIVRRAVELHGGTIDFTSAEGQGTTFTITLPRHPAHPARTLSALPLPARSVVA